MHGAALINDDTDDLLLADRDTVVVTQATSANDTFPTPYGDQAGEEALFGELGAPGNKRRASHSLAQGVALEQPEQDEDELAGLGEVRTATRLMRRPNVVLARGRSKQARLPLAGARGHGGFIPGLGDEDEMAGLGEVRSAHRLTRQPNIVLSRGRSKQTRIPFAGPRAQASFIPGLGDNADGEDLCGLGAAPERFKPKAHVTRVNAMTRSGAPTMYTPPMRMPNPRGGFMPGLGDVSVMGLGVPALIAIGLGAYFLLRKRR